ALASITPEERDRVVAYYQQQSAADSGSASKTEEPVPVRREPPIDRSGKVRKLQPRTPKPRTVADQTDAEAAPSAGESVKSAEAAETVPKEDQQSEKSDVAARQVSPQAADDSEESAPIEPGGQGTTKSPAMTRDVHASPTGGSRMREMRPIGTVSSNEPTRAKPRLKPKAQGPNIASAPELKIPKKKQPKAEQAQQPEIRLTSDLLDQQSPLGDQLRKHAEKKTRKDEDDSEEGIRKGRSLIEERRRSNKKLTETLRETGSQTTTRRRRPIRRRGRTGAAVQLKTEATIDVPITLRGLCEAIGRTARDLMKTLMQQGQMITINELIDEETALMLAMEHGVDLTIKRETDIEAELLTRFEEEGDPEQLQPRPPVVTILGHVDHGKTTLLDKMRSANVAGGEAGGITQHIAAYQVEHNGQKITFVDTPGHAAFGEMRARGANITDIIILVVAADDGVMPQTQECISHARSAGVPMIVALNKMDLPDINEQKVLQELTQFEILPAEWGGEVEVIRTSGETGKGLDELLETILVTAELQEYKANSSRPAVGVCVEGFMDEGRGPIAWLMVKSGTLRIGDCVLCGSSYGRIRAIYNDRNEELTEATPSMPVKVAGFESVPGAGDKFYVFDDIERAREIATARSRQDRTQVLARRNKPASLEDILGAVRAGKIQDLSLIVKADSPGSLEAIRGELGKFDHPEVRVNILHEGVGGVNESDVYLASASKAVILAFHVIAEDRAESLADEEGVEIRRYSIIYELIQEIRDALEGMLSPERIQVTTGRALVLRTFSISRMGTIAGCRVLNGTIDRNCRVHVIRDQTIINHYALASLKREKDDVREVREGMECGIRLEGFNDIKEGDLLESFRIEEKKRTLDDVASSKDE
ncbi:MAG TPA: translation initiation factor IF-2, partial [Planctomycetaceae bacterium]|nr:translation initiation factor IF-2 [Planctomycetaceae bacterium]